MEDNSNSTKITHINNLNKHNFNLTLNISIDNNTQIKTILNLHSFMFDEKVECGSGKAILTGKIGVKVLYIDTDNMTNSISDFATFTETINDPSITTNSYLMISNHNIISNVLSTDGTLKINCDINIKPVSYLNLGISKPIEINDSLVTKNREIKTNTISNFINTSFEYNCVLETRDKISKVLCQNNYFACDKVTSNDGFVTVEGKILSCVVFEVQDENGPQIKEIKESTPLKTDIELNVRKEDLLDLKFNLDCSKESFSTEEENGSNTILTKHFIKVYGVSLKEVSIPVVDDLFSVSNEIETTSVSRECTKNIHTHTASEIVSNEVVLDKDEVAIDEIISNMSISEEITNTYVKDGTIFLEGVISSNFAYLDENKEYKTKHIDLPFVVNTKIPAETLELCNSNVYIIDQKVKVKRGTIIEFEYTLLTTITIFEKDKCNIVDSFSLGKPLNFGGYDYQIFIAKPEETVWELCKRIKISPNDIHLYNKDLPLVMNGGEKIIIKR